MLPGPDHRARPAPVPLRAMALALCAALSLGGCQRVGVPPAPSPASLPACEEPSLDRSSWPVQQDSAGVVYRVPPGFTVRSSSDPPFREFVYAGEPSGRIMVGLSPSREYYVTLRRAPSPGMHEMSECVDEVAGRPLLLQSWRTEGGSFRNGRRYDLFEVHALVSLGPTTTLYVTGGGDGPDFQALLLAVARSVEAGPR